MVKGLLQETPDAQAVADARIEARGNDHADARGIARRDAREDARKVARTKARMMMPGDAQIDARKEAIIRARGDARTSAQAVQEGFTKDPVKGLQSHQCLHTITIMEELKLAKFIEANMGRQMAQTVCK